MWCVWGRRWLPPEHRCRVLSTPFAALAATTDEDCRGASSLHATACKRDHEGLHLFISRISTTSEHIAPSALWPLAAARGNLHNHGCLTYALYHRSSTIRLPRPSGQLPVMLADDAMCRDTTIMAKETAKRTFEAKKTKQILSRTNEHCPYCLALTSEAKSCSPASATLRVLQTPAISVV